MREGEKQLQEAEKLSSEREKAAQEVQNLRTKLDQTPAKIDGMESSLENEAELRRLKQLRKNLEADFDNAKKEVAALEKLAKNTAKNTVKERDTVNKLRKDIAEKERERNDLGRGAEQHKNPRWAE